jgi:anti-sigma B factor antagonist
LLSHPSSPAPQARSAQPSPTHFPQARVVAAGDRAHLGFAGVIDVSNADAFAATIAAQLAARPDRCLRVDLGAVRLIDSTGIQALVECRRLARDQGCDIVVVNPRPFVAKIFGIVGVLDLLADAEAATA